MSRGAEPPLLLHVIHHLVTGGMENGLVNLVGALGEYRHAIACVEDYSDFRQRITRPDVDVVALHRSRIGAPALRRSLYALCRRLRPAVVHTRALSGLDAIVPARLAGVRHVVHGEHGWDVDNLDGRRWKPALLRRLHAPLVSRWVAVSKDLERFVVDRVGVRPARIAQIYNGVDTARFTPAAAPGDRDPRLPASFRAVDAVCFGSVGRLQPVKDQATLLDATALLLERRPGLRRVARLALIGDGPLLEPLRRRVERLGLADVAWLPGATIDVPPLLRSLDVFVLPSLNEGVSNTVLEAMASGLPVVATAVGGNVELVDADATGVLVPPADAAALAAALERYVDDAALRRRHGLAARRRVEQHFALGTMVAHYRALYDGFCRR